MNGSRRGPNNSCLSSHRAQMSGCFVTGSHISVLVGVRVWQPEKGDSSAREGVRPSAQHRHQLEVIHAVVLLRSGQHASKCRVQIQYCESRKTKQSVQFR